MRGIRLGQMAILVSFVVVGAQAQLPRGHRIYSRLSGIGVPQELSKKIADLDKSKDWSEIASRAVDDPNFINLTVRDFAAELTNKDHNPVTPLNDLTALVVGTAKDDLDARQILYGDYHYLPADDTALAPRSESNDAFATFDKRRLPLSSKLKKADQPYGADSAGALTTRAWGDVQLNMGTNRRAVKAVMEEFLCAPIMTWKDATLDKNRIWRDVDRAPNGQKADFEQNCRGCHAPMDSFASAFAYMDFVNGKLVFNRADRKVMAKLHNKAILPPAEPNGKPGIPIGHMAEDDSWVNALEGNPMFGWDSKSEHSGNGPKSLGKLLAESDRFAYCMAWRAFRKVCRQVPDPKNEKEILRTAIAGFKVNYSLKKLFAEVAAQESCTGDDRPAALKNFREYYEFLLTQSQEKISSDLEAIYEAEKNKLPKIGFRDEFTPDVQNAAFKLSSMVCRKMADRNRPGAEAPEKAFQSLAQRFWKRSATDEELTIATKKFAKLTDPTGQWIALCTMAASSPAALFQ